VIAFVTEKNAPSSKLCIQLSSTGRPGCLLLSPPPSGRVFPERFIFYPGPSKAGDPLPPAARPLLFYSLTFFPPPPFSGTLADHPNDCVTSLSFLLCNFSLTSPHPNDCDSSLTCLKSFWKCSPVLVGIRSFNLHFFTPFFPPSCFYFSASGPHSTGSDHFVTVRLEGARFRLFSYIFHLSLVPPLPLPTQKSPPLSFRLVESFSQI